MASKEPELKKLERRAKSLLMDKDISPGKKEIVRSIMGNQEFEPKDRYSAIIELIKTCPDKKKQVRKADIPASMRTVKQISKKLVEPKEPPPEKYISAPTSSSIYINDLYSKYRKLKIFKKAYFIHSNNRFGIGIKKRLIPSARLIRAVREIIEFQEKILARHPEIMLLILKDEEITDPVNFNYLRVFRKWMVETPLIEYRMNTIKWMDEKNFEAELKNFVLYFFMFQKLSIDQREQMITLVENKLREMDDLKKEIIDRVDPQSVKRNKEKMNFVKENIIHEYMMLFRSFLPAGMNAENVLSDHLKLNYKVSSYPEFLILLMEALVFKRQISLPDLEKYYEIRSPAVNRIEWDYSLEELKKAGKDQESIKNKRIEALKKTLEPYEELYSLCNFKIGGQDVLLRGFEDQWRIADKRQKDFSKIYEDDYFAFLDGCINFFNNCLVSFLDGGNIYFEDKKGMGLEGAIFSPGYFSEEIRTLDKIIGDIHYFKSKNPTLILNRVVMKRILNGGMRSMADVQGLFIRAGGLFYEIGSEMKSVYALHNKWNLDMGFLKSSEEVIMPLQKIRSADDSRGIPIPYFDCKITGFEKGRLLSKSLFGKTVLVDISQGVFIHCMAFAYQLAYECMSEQLLNELQERKNILDKLKEIAG